jgi:hypothetical protein
MQELPTFKGHVIQRSQPGADQGDDGAPVALPARQKKKPGADHGDDGADVAGNIIFYTSLNC